MTLGLLLGQPVTIGDVPDQPDGQLRLPLEALLRLIGGRLPEKHTPAGVDITGSLSLADLRAVFPGY
jgi:hypothetical protein